MANCLQTAQEFILDAFPVMVGSLASEDAELLCQKNDLSFVELIRPFCQLESETQIHDPINPSVVVSIRNWKIRIVDIQSSLPPPVLVSRILNEVVNKSVSLEDLRQQSSPESQATASTPWFEAYRDCFFQLVQPMTHEFLRDYLACILVVSTKHPDPMHAFAALSSRQNNIQNSTDRQKNSFRWFSNNTFKYYLLLHDVSDGDDSKAEKIFLSMKSVYGSHTCFLLKINSRQKMSEQGAATNSDPWSSHIYPFENETLEFDDEAVEKQPTLVITNQTDADRKEQAIVNELESIEKQIAEHPEAPTRSLSFNDPLTSMHYDTLDEEGTDTVASLAALPPKDNPSSVKQTSERSHKYDEYRRSLRQFSYHKVTSIMQSPRKERGHCMTSEDQDKIKNFVFEFAVRGLLPHIEKLMRNLSEQILNRRGLHKSLFHATKKWFGSNKTQAATVGAGLSTSASYPTDSPELQHRKLGDLSFLVQNYELAYTSYHSAKREFNNDHAWLYFAGSLEMAAISAFLQVNNKNYPVHYFEACISTYLNTCRLPEFATRACLLSTETLKAKQRFSEAAVEFIKLTSEDSELRSALLLEQASHCYLRHKPAMLRKYAFHMILAGHRFSKAMQRKHSLRCYINALQVYRDRGWHLAEDHVNFVIGRQSFNLGNMDDAYLALRSLMTYESEQPPSQQASHLREFLAVFKQNVESQQSKAGSSTMLPELPLPNIKAQLTRCITYFKGQILPPTPLTSTPSVNKRTRSVHAGAYTFQKNYSKTYIDKWMEMEKKIVQHVTGDLPYPFKPFTPCLSSKTSNTSPAIIAVGEQFAYEVIFSNPLKIPLNLLGLTLLFEYTAESGENEGNEPPPLTNKEESLSNFVDCEVIENFAIKPSENKPVCLKVTVKAAGHFKILGVKYTLSSTGVTNSLDEQGNVSMDTHQQAALQSVGVSGMQLIHVKGPRLNKSKQHKSIATYDVDKRLEMKILPQLPLLEVIMSDLPVTLLCGEVQRASFTFKNIGSVPLKSVHLVCSCPQAFSFDGEAITWDYVATDNPEEKVLKIMNNTSNCDILKLPLNEDVLCPGEVLTIPVSVYGLTTPGVHELYFLFYYEPAESISKVKYRLVQQMIRMQTLSTMTVNTSVQPSLCRPTTAENAPVENRVNVDEYILSLAIENRAQGSLNLRCVEFTLKSLTCYSNRLHVQSLVTLPQETYLLRPGETCSLHLKTSTSNNIENDKYIISNISLDNTVDACTLEPCMDLFLQYKKNVSAMKDSFAVILNWETFFIDESFTRNVIHGQSHVIFPFPIQPPPDNLDDAERKLRPVIPAPTDGIKLSYHYDTVNRHDFTKSSICIVPITVQCSNATNENARIEIEASDINELEYNNTIDSADQGSYFNPILWSGHRHRIVNVPSQSSLSIQLDLLTTIGLHEIQYLSAWLIKTLENGSTERLPISLPRSHFVCVVSS